jgi:curli biogenesis system outer membrane secretion channel CsgG
MPSRSIMPLLLTAMLLGLGSACATVPNRRVTAPESDEPLVSPALQPPNGRFLRRKVSIERFSNETTYGKSPLLGEDILGKQASDIIAARLAASEKFILLDDGVSDQVIGAADFRLVGSVSEFGRATSSESGMFSKTKTQVARAAVNLRIVDSRTGIVVFSAEGRGEATSSSGKVFGVGTAQGFDSTLSESAISAAISSVVGSVAERLLDSPWRSSVLDVEGSKIMIGGGRSQGLQPGDRLRVMQRGKTIQNPQTNAMIELPGTEVAVLEVRACHGTSYADEFSMCEIVSGSLGDTPKEQLAVQEQEKEPRP